MLNRAGFKKMFFTLLHLARQDARLLQQIQARELVVVLNLHQVSPHQNHFWPPLSPRVFEDLLIFLKQHFEVTRFDALAQTTDAHPRAILSFDDGYHNFVEYAQPLLEKHNLTANLNVIPECVETGKPIWNVRLYDFLNVVPRSLINELRLPDFTERLDDDSATNKTRFGLRLSRFLKNRAVCERDALWPHIEALMGKADVFPVTRMMNAEDVRAAARKHEIGAHSFAHESMAFQDDQFFQDDSRRCFDYFRTKLRLPLTIYAFPNGSHRAGQPEWLQQAGVEHVLLVGERFSTVRERVHPRFTIYGLSAVEARFQALGYHGRKTII